MVCNVFGPWILKTHHHRMIPRDVQGEDDAELSLLQWLAHSSIAHLITSFAVFPSRLGIDRYGLFSADADFFSLAFANNRYGCRFSWPDIYQQKRHNDDNKCYKSQFLKMNIYCLNHDGKKLSVNAANIKTNQIAAREHAECHGMNVTWKAIGLVTWSNYLDWMRSTQSVLPALVSQ